LLPIVLLPDAAAPSIAITDGRFNESPLACCGFVPLAFETLELRDLSVI
jgi:hypothetical protein